MAEVRVRVLPEHDNDEAWWDSYGHPLPRGIEVLIFYRDGTIGTGITRWNEPPQFGCICWLDDHNPDCPYPFIESLWGSS